MRAGIAALVAAYVLSQFYRAFLAVMAPVLGVEIGAGADDLAAAMDLCVSCKGCKRECPTGVDMARMKIEFQAQWNAKHGIPLRERIVAHTLLGRVGSPDDIARTVAFLLFDAPYVTGQILAVDGGRSAHL